EEQADPTREIVNVSVIRFSGGVLHLHANPFAHCQAHLLAPNPVDALEIVPDEPGARGGAGGAGGADFAIGRVVKALETGEPFGVRGGAAVKLVADVNELLAHDADRFVGKDFALAVAFGTARGNNHFIAAHLR